MSWFCPLWQRFVSSIMSGISAMARCEMNFSGFSPPCTPTEIERSDNGSGDESDIFHREQHVQCQPHCSTPTSGTNAPFSLLTNSFNNIIVRSTKPYYISTIQPTHLFDLPNDLLLEIIRHSTHCCHDSPSYPPQQVVEPRTYASAKNFALVSKKACELFYRSMDDVSFAATRHGDKVVKMIALRSGTVLKRLVLRGAKNITNESLLTLAKQARHLRCLDLSFIDTVNSNGLIPVCKALSGQLRFLLIRKCIGIDDRALVEGVSKCERLETLDMSYCFLITDVGVCSVVSGDSGKSMTLLAMAHCPYITNSSFGAIGNNCRYLRQFCARGLPGIDNGAVPLLCNGSAKVGWSLEGLDMTLCQGLKRDATISDLQTYCPKISKNVRFDLHDAAKRSLKQVIISCLRQNIFIVHGSDPDSGKDTVHTVVIDNGDLVSASLLSSGTTDLSLLGIVLCKSYGSTLSDETKQLLEIDYGIPSNALTD